MWVPLLLLASFACVGLIAALRPEAFTRYFLAEYQRKALSRQLKFVSAFGWVFLSGSVLLFIALIFQSELDFLAPIVGSLLFFGLRCRLLMVGHLAGP
jgi:hypothetical protein